MSDTELGGFVLRFFADHGSAPAPADLSAAGLDAAEAPAALRRRAAGHAQLLAGVGLTGPFWSLT